MARKYLNYFVAGGIDYEDYKRVPGANLTKSQWTAVVKFVSAYLDYADDPTIYRALVAAQKAYQEALEKGVSARELRDWHDDFVPSDNDLWQPAKPKRKRSSRR
jgi:hypothetical protein